MERLAVTGRLAASIAHEINNPFQAIFVHTGFIEKSVPENFKDKKSIEQIKIAMNWIRNMVHLLFDIHSSKSSVKTNVNIHEIIESTLNLLEDQLLINTVVFLRYTQTQKIKH